MSKTVKYKNYVDPVSFSTPLFISHDQRFKIVCSKVNWYVQIIVEKLQILVSKSDILYYLLTT